MIHQSERRNPPEKYWLMKTKLLFKYPRGRPSNFTRNWRIIIGTVSSSNLGIGRPMCNQVNFQPDLQILIHNFAISYDWWLRWLNLNLSDCHDISVPRLLLTACSCYLFNPTNLCWIVTWWGSFHGHRIQHIVHSEFRPPETHPRGNLPKWKNQKFN